MIWGLAFVAAVACGGKAFDESIGDGASAGDSRDGSHVADSSGGGSGGDGSGADGSSDSSDDAALESGTTDAPDEAGPACVDTGGSGGSGSGGGCDISVSEMCGTTSYMVDCSCPAATCTCTGSSGGVLTFMGCPSCPTATQAYDVCGYPHL